MPRFPKGGAGGKQGLDVGSVPEGGVVHDGRRYGDIEVRSRGRSTGAAQAFVVVACKGARTRGKRNGARLGAATGRRIRMGR